MRVFEFAQSVGCGWLWLAVSWGCVIDGGQTPNAIPTVLVILLCVRVCVRAQACLTYLRVRSVLKRISMFFKCLMIIFVMISSYGYEEFTILDYAIVI